EPDPTTAPAQEPDPTTAPAQEHDPTQTPESKVSATAPPPKTGSTPATSARSRVQSAPASDTGSDSSSTASTATADPQSGEWTAPVRGARVSNPFGVPNASYAAGYHTGTDWAVPTGTPLYAITNATVVSAANDGAYGNEIVLKLPDGKYAQYAHLSKLLVTAGQSVTTGQQIGLSGSTGNATGPHLHFEIRTTNTYGAVIDPVAYLASHGVTVS
ncbi:M23 family metallopeptidase, partial [Kitasatospora sp. MBT63]